VRRSQRRGSELHRRPQSTARRRASALTDALELCLLPCEHEPRRYERAALRRRAVLPGGRGREPGRGAGCARAPGRPPGIAPARCGGLPGRASRLSRRPRGQGRRQRATPGDRGGVATPELSDPHPFPSTRSRGDCDCVSEYTPGNDGRPNGTNRTPRARVFSCLAAAVTQRVRRQTVWPLAAERRGLHRRGR
jgi:hypothetical protein